MSIKTANLSYFENSDLTTLLGNILDNAVEAARDSERRKIDLSLNKMNGFDILTCTNSSDNRPCVVGNNLKTTKKEADLHGLGIKSIKRIAKKYSGSFEWSYDDAQKEFTVYVAFN
ncbi:MAG: ATP-binding protein [Oscillospiraceae bacterium]|nr:ATP-binding protein [Oscillospiraceae bacterium]